MTYDEFIALGRPDAELGGDLAPHPVAHREDHVQVVVGQCSADLAAALLANCSEFPNSCDGVDAIRIRSLMGACDDDDDDDEEEDQ